METGLRKRVSVFILLIILIFIGIMLKDLYPIIREIMEHTHDEAQTMQYIEAYGKKGIPILISLEALQAAVFFIPAAAIEVLAGLCYGVKYGILISFTGFAIGNGALFYLMRQFKGLCRNNKQSLLSGKDTLKWLPIETLRTSKHPEYLVFTFYLLPGMPNGVLPYFFSTSKISFLKFMLSMMLGSLPSIVLCTWIGDHFSKGRIVSSLLLLVLLLGVVLFVFLFRGKISRELQRMHLK